MSLNLNPTLKPFLKNLFTATALYCFVMTQSLFLILATQNDAKALTPNGNFVDVAGIVPDGSTRTITDRTQGGVATVYIAPPSAGGVSNNHMADFQNNENTIINNYKGVSTHSQLENGQVIGNPNYGAGVNQANIILMQVTGGNRTNMRAVTEIVGKNAEYIIANPNGIDVAGARFINTSKLALVTGTANLDSGGNLGKFNISNNAGSNIVIRGVNNNGAINLGLDASNVNYVDIVSRSIQVLGNVIGSSELTGQLNFKTGNHQYDYLTKNITSDSSKGSTTKPIFALDSSHLGGMYAGRINLIATEAGLGVTTRGDLIADAGDINFNSVGDIGFEAASANGNVNITSTNGNITGGQNQDSTHIASAFANGNINITATDGDVNLLGQGHSNWLINGSKINIFAGNNLSLTNSSILSRDEDLTLEANQNIALKDQELYTALKNISITSNLGNIIINSDSSPSVISSALNSKIESKLGNINISGFEPTQIGGVNIDLVAKNILDFDNLMVAASQNLTLQADNNITLKNHQFYADNGDVNITSLLGDVALQNGSLQSLIQAGYDANINAGGKLEIENSKIIAGDIALTSNQNLTLANQELHGLFGNNAPPSFADANSLPLNRGNITITSNLGNIAVSESIIKADQDLKIEAKVGDVLTNGITKSLIQGLNKAEILSGNNLDLSNVIVQSVGNVKLSAGNNITLQDYNLYSVNGTVDAASALGNVKLQSTIGAAFSTIIADNGNININAGNDLEIANSQIGGSNVEFIAKNILNFDNLVIVANQDLTLQADSDITIQNSELYANKGNITSNLGNIALISDSSSSIIASSLDNKIEAKAGSINISGAMQSALQSFGTVELLAAGDIDMQNNQIIATNVGLVAGSNLTLRNNQEIYIYAPPSFSNENSLPLDRGNLTASSGLDMDLTGLTIQAIGGINLTAGDNINLIDNNIESLGDNINLTSLRGNINLTNDEISSDLDTNLTAAGDITNSSSIFASRDINLFANNLINNKTLAASGDLNAVIGNNLTNQNNGQNSGVIFAGGNIDLQVANTLNNNNAAIIAIGDLLLNGKKQISTSLIIDPFIFGNVGFAFGNPILDDLVARGYVDANGNLTDAFNALDSEADLVLSDNISYYKTNIFNALKAKSDAAKLANDGSNFLGNVQKNFDNLSPQILDRLKAQGYVDANGKLTEKFYTETSALDANGVALGGGALNLGDASLDCCFKDDIYQLLAAAAQGKISENTFIELAGSTNDATLLLTQLEDKGFVDANGNPTTAFNSLVSADGIVLDAAFAGYNKQTIFDLIKNQSTIGKVAPVTFSNITKEITTQHTQNITPREVFDQLQQSGYIDAAGNVDSNLPTDFANFVLPDNFASEKQNIFDQLTALKAASTAVGIADLNPITSQQSSTQTITADQTQIYNFLKTGGFIDENDQVTDKYFADAAILPTILAADFSGFETQIATVLASLPVASINQNSLKNINHNLESSVLSLLDDLQQRGFIDENGKATAVFNNLADSSSFTVSEDFASYKQLIFDQIKTTATNDAEHNFGVLDFLGAGFDSDVFFDQHQELFVDLASGGYLDAKGNITQKFYDLAGNYEDLEVDDKFTALKTQIGQFLSSAPQAGLQAGNIQFAAENSDANQAKLIQDQLVANGYLTAAGAFTDKLKNDVFGHSASDSQNYQQLDLGASLADSREAIYLSLKNKRDNNLIITKTATINNSNGGMIKSLLGDLEIHANNLNNFGKDNFVVNENAIALINGSPILTTANEAAINRTMSGILNRAWKSTVLYRTEFITSKLTSNPAYISASGDIKIEAGDILNKSSTITAGGDLSITANNLNNRTTAFLAPTRQIYESHSKHCKRFRGCKEYRSFSTRWSEVEVRSNTPAIISAGGTVNLKVAHNLSNGNLKSGSSSLALIPTITAPINTTNGTGSGSSSGSSSGTGSLLSSKGVAVLSSIASGNGNGTGTGNGNNGNGSLASITAPINLPPDLLLPDAQARLFTTPDASSPFLNVTTLPAFSNQNQLTRQLTGSAYYNARFGFDPMEDNVKWIGDPFYQFNLVNQQILQATKTQAQWKRFDAENEGAGSPYLGGASFASGKTMGVHKPLTWEDNLNQMIDNAYAQKEELGLTPGVTLSATQIAALRSDIVWYEEVEVEVADGQGGVRKIKVMTPKVYLANNSFDGFNSNDGSVILGNAVNINTGSPCPGGASLCQQTMGVNNLNNSLNNSGNILARQNLAINSTGDITNAGGSIQSLGGLSLTAAGNINNQSTIATLNGKTSAGEIQFNRASILAGGGMLLNSERDIVNTGGQIKAGEGLALIAAGNIINQALIDYKINDKEATKEQALASEANKIRSTLVSQGNIESSGDLVLIANNDITNTASNLKAQGDINLITVGGNVVIESTELRDRTVTEWGNKRKGGTITDDTTTNVISEVDAGGSFNINSGNSTILNAADISAGSNVSINSANNLLITTATDSNLHSEETKEKGTFTFKNNNRGTFDTKVINTNIAAGVANDLNNQAIEIQTGNQNYVEYNKNAIANPPASLSSYLTKLNDNQTLYNPIEETHKHWDETTRGLTAVSQIIIAIIVTAIMPGGVGVLAAMASAAGTVAATTAATSAINAGMNADGNLLGSLDDIGKTVVKDTTSSDALRSMAIAAATAGITKGVADKFSSTAVKGATTSTTLVNPLAAYAPAASNASTLGTQLANGFRDAAINTVANSAAQSAVNGDSFTDSLQNAAQNILINAVGQVAANQIGNLAHNGEINTATQLTLHAGLGCVMGTAANGSGGCASGAAAGVVGELSAGFADKTLGLNDNQIKTFSGLTGATAALITSVATGQDDQTTANNIFSGQMIGTNAAANNYLTRKVFGKETEEKLDKVLSEIKGKTLDEIADQYVRSNDPIEKAGLFAILSINSVTLPSSTTELELMIATAGISTAFANPLARGLNKVDEVGNNWWGRVFGVTDNAIEATGFKGSRGFELSNVGGQTRNTSATINEIDYSAHALDQMQNRGVMPSVVENTINNGVIFNTRVGTTGFFDSANQVKVIVNSQNGRVITVIRGGQ